MNSERHDRIDQAQQDDLAWLPRVLAADPSPEMPEAVADQILAALRAEQASREVGEQADDFAPMATAHELDESLDESLGTDVDAAGYRPQWSVSHEDDLTETS